MKLHDPDEITRIKTYYSVSVRPDENCPQCGFATNANGDCLCHVAAAHCVGVNDVRRAIGIAEMPRRNQSVLEFPRREDVPAGQNAPERAR